MYWYGNALIYGVSKLKQKLEKSVIQNDSGETIY